MQLKTALGLLQFQTDYRKTAAKSAADHRFPFVDLALVITLTPSATRLAMR
jgi:hypothetical protein